MIERKRSRMFGIWLPLTCTLLVLDTAATPAQEPDLATIDKNENGVIEPAEIPVRDLTVIARYASLAGLEISSPMPIAAIKQGRERYLNSLDGGGAELQLAGEHEFGRVRQTSVRPFGTMGSFIDSYTPGVRQGTIATFQKFDANRDGLLTQEELSYAYRVYSRLWMRGDRDGNGMLTFPELAQSIAADQERRNAGRAHEQSTWNVDGLEITPQHRERAARLMTKYDRNKNGRLEAGEIPEDWKTGSFLTWADQNEDGQISQKEMQVGAAHDALDSDLASVRKRDPDLQHCAALAADIIRRFDLDKDRGLHRSEWQRIGGDLSDGDLNGNGLIVEDELARWLLSRVSTQAGADLPEDLPNWFLESDSDLDSQVTHAEFIAAQPSQLFPEFQYRDRNCDGIVTADELEGRGTLGSIRYTSSAPRVLPAEREVESAIFVPDAFTIADIDVEVFIVKNGDDDLNLRLVGPDGTTAVLFYTSSRKAWGGGPMFRGTLIDDEAPQAPQRLPQPPAHQSFRPQSVGSKTMASLSAFDGKPAKGNWRLMIGNKGQNKPAAGLLQAWSLLIKPPADGAGESSGENGSSAAASLIRTGTE